MTKKPKQVVPEMVQLFDWLDMPPKVQDHFRKTCLPDTAGNDSWYEMRNYEEWEDDDIVFLWLKSRGYQAEYRCFVNFWW